MAQFISDTFYDFDMAVLTWVHSFAEKSGELVRLVMTLITYTGYGGLFLIAVGLILTAFKKTRKCGICALASMAVGYLITNLGLKNIVDRIRPYEMHETLHEWWLAMGGMTESDSSFPSGHANVAAAFSTAIMLTGGKKALWLIIYVAAISFSRLYFVVHYPSDVIAGIITGTVSGFIGTYIVKKLYRPRKLEDNS